MHIIVCVDDKFGMAFGKRRQSTDVVLRNKIIDLCKGHLLWMREYTAKQFEKDSIPNLFIDVNYLQKAQKGDFCFVELDEILDVYDRIETIILFRWNRTYPATLHLKIPGNNQNWHVEVIDEFPGKSHEKITTERWNKL